MAGDESLLVKAERAAAGLIEGAERLADRVAPPSERDLIRRALALPMGRQLLLVRRVWRDPRVRDVTRLPMIAGLVYLVLPVRLLPPVFGPLRRWEKLIALVALLWLLVRLTPEDVLREHLDAVE